MTTSCHNDEILLTSFPISNSTSDGAMVTLMADDEVEGEEHDPTAFADSHPPDAGNDMIVNERRFVDVVTRSNKLSRTYNKATKQDVLADAVELTRHQLFLNELAPRGANAAYRKYRQHQPARRQECAPPWLDPRDAKPTLNPTGTAELLDPVDPEPISAMGLIRCSANCTQQLLCTIC